MNQKFIENIKYVSEKLNQAEIKWFLIGGSNQKLQGLERDANDLDIGIKYEDLEKVKRIFNENRIYGESDSFDKKGKRFKFKYNDSEIDIVATQQDGAYFSRLGKRDFDKISIDNIEVSCYPLDLEADIYENYGRPERAEMIKQLIKSKEINK